MLAFRCIQNLYGRNRAIVIAESLARVIAAMRITSVRRRSCLSPKHTETSPHRPCVRCPAIRIARLALIRVTFALCETQNGLREMTAFAECWRLAIGDWRFAHLRVGSSSEKVDIASSASSYMAN